MHDPESLAFDIKNPFLPAHTFNGKFSYRETLIHIWHVDPETRGEDTCGWFRPRLTDKELEKIRKIVSFEAKHIYDPGDGGKLVGKGNTLEAVFFIMRTVAWQVWRRQLKPRHALLAMDLSLNPFDSFEASFREGQVYDDYDIERTFFFIAMSYLRMERPWYKHPRFHFWHYNINVIPFQNFKRWAFSRCETCSKGFSWGYAPTSNGWGGKGPRWFRGEPGVHHSSCLGQGLANKPVAEKDISISEGTA